MSDPVPTPPGAAPAPTTPQLRFARAIVIAALALALSFLGLLNAITSVPLIRDSLGPLVWEHKADSPAAILVTLAVAVLVPIIALIICSRRGWLRWPQLVALSAIVLATFVYLSWDEPTVRRPLTMDELSPPLPGDEATFQVFLRYAKNSPAANAVKSPKTTTLVAESNFATKPEPWAQFLREHRADVEADWAALAPVRSWWDELAAQPRIGDLTPPRPDAPIIAFQAVRAYTQIAVAVACLQALDGHGDEAMATVTRLYDVARKFEPNSRTLVRTMVGKVMQRMALQAGGFVLDHAAVSPASRATFAAEISAGALGAAGARRLILIEYAFFQPMFSLFIGGTAIGGQEDQRIFQQVVHYLGHLVVNPIATQNFVGDRYYALAALAAERRLGELEVNKGPIDRDSRGGYRVKNIGGRLFADAAMPALSKVTKSYWDIEDLRVALLARLKS